MVFKTLIGATFTCLTVDYFNANTTVSGYMEDNFRMYKNTLVISIHDLNLETVWMEHFND